mmetsp:Transcript_68963/g.84545  ORF Transcript_68963/g.84545 Transcript_68963/m.84545 type:complete len:96 (+) Transcript_68963:228-515(+)
MVDVELVEECPTRLVQVEVEVEAVMAIQGGLGELVANAACWLAPPLQAFGTTPPFLEPLVAVTLATAEAPVSRQLALQQGGVYQSHLVVQLPGPP